MYESYWPIISGIMVIFSFVPLFYYAGHAGEWIRNEDGSDVRKN